MKPQGSVTLYLDDLPCEFDLEFVYDQCDEEHLYRGYTLKSAAITDIHEPSYTCIERFIRWLGDILHIERMASFHQGSTIYEFEAEEIVWWDDPLCQGPEFDNDRGE